MEAKGIDLKSIIIDKTMIDLEKPIRKTKNGTKKKPEVEQAPVNEYKISQEEVNKIPEKPLHKVYPGNAKKWPRFLVETLPPEFIGKYDIAEGERLKEKVKWIIRKQDRELKKQQKKDLVLRCPKCGIIRPCIKDNHECNELNRNPELIARVKRGIYKVKTENKERLIKTKTEIEKKVIKAIKIYINAYSGYSDKDFDNQKKVLKWLERVTKMAHKELKYLLKQVFREKMEVEDLAGSLLRHATMK
jgi:hypothetical protein